MGVLLVAYSEALGVAHEFAEKHGYEVDADQELNAHAVANMSTALFGGMIGGRRMSASAVKEGAGAQLAGGESGHLGSDHYHLTLPHPFVCPAARSRAGSADHPRRLAYHRRASSCGVYAWSRAPSFGWALTALAGVLLIERVARHDHRRSRLVGVRHSTASSRPHVSSLGHVPGAAGAYSDLSRNPENTPVPGVLDCAFQGHCALLRQCAYRAPPA